MVVLSGPSALRLLAPLVVALAAYSSIAPAPRAAGVIAGHVEVSAAVAGLPSVPDPAALGMGSGNPPADRRRAVVYLDPAPRAAFDAREAPRARMDQRDERFVPRVLAIVAGTTVDFPNNDRTYHNVFSLSKPRTFDLGRYAAGRSKSVRFDTPGIVRVFCDIHSHMSAHILVFAHHYFAVTGDDGGYRIADVPSGTYTVVAWHEATEPESRRVTVTGERDPVVDFVLRRR